jgi:hypothetical protein
LRSYSNPVNLKRFDGMGWMTTKEEIFYIPEYLADVKHHKILKRKHILNLRPADAVEVKAGSVQEWVDSKGSAPKYPII